MNPSFPTIRFPPLGPNTMKNFLKLWIGNIATISIFLGLLCCFYGVLVLPMMVGDEWGVGWTVAIYISEVLIGCGVAAYIKTQDG